jgi:hypothetical protein
MSHGSTPMACGPRCSTMPDELGPFLKEDDGYAVRLGDGTRRLLAELSRQSRLLIEHEDPSTDPAMDRLFPPAYPDDPLADLEFENALGDAPKREKLAALGTVERTADADHLTEDELLAWIGVVNDIRLILGTRLEVTDDPDDEGPEQDDPSWEAYQLYDFLGELLHEMIVQAGAPEIDEPAD